MLIAACSLKASPGVSTLAIALGAVWPEQETPIVVEADPAGGDLLARWRLPDSPDLVSLAAAARRGSDPDLLLRHTHCLPGGLRVVAGPVGAEQAQVALSALVVSGSGHVLRQAANTAGLTVIVDCGQVDSGSPVLPIIRTADVLLVVTRPRDEELARIALQMPAIQRWSARPCLVLAGDGYPSSEVSQVLGIPVLARVPHDSTGAAVLGGRGGGRAASVRTGVGRAAQHIAAWAYASRPQSTIGSSPGLSQMISSPSVAPVMPPVLLRTVSGVKQ